MSFGTATKTLADVIEDVRRTFGDESSVQITDKDIARWTSAAQREILINNRVLRTVGDTVSVAGQSAYSVSELKILAIQSIHYNGVKVEYLSFNEAEEYVLKNDPSKTSTGTPQIWYEWGGVINLYPVPDVDGATITLYYVKEPDEVSTSNGNLAVPDQYFENVVQFVLSKAYELDEDQDNFQIKKVEFSQRLQTLSEQEATPQQDYYPFITELPDDAWGWG